MYFGGKRYTLPDPLVPATLAPPAWKRVARHQATAFWFDVHAPTGTPPGRYGTSITQSGCASRPGNGYVPILGQMLNTADKLPVPAARLQPQRINRKSLTGMASPKKRVQSTPAVLG